LAGKRLTPVRKQATGMSGGGMPIKAEMRWFYPIDWPQLSRHVRFERAGGVCQGCGRPHGAIVRVLPNGRWHDETRQTWRNHRGCPVRWPDIEEAARMRQTRHQCRGCVDLGVERGAGIGHEAQQPPIEHVTPGRPRQSRPAKL
jgi:hypothetical protein